MTDVSLSAISGPLGFRSIFITYTGTRIPALRTDYSEPYGEGFAARGLWLKTKNDNRAFDQGFKSNCFFDFVLAFQHRRVWLPAQH